MYDANTIDEVAAWENQEMITYSSLVVVALYLGITLFISYRVNKSNCADSDFSTGGKQFGSFAPGISILATYISAMTFVGMPGWVYHSGMQAMSMHLNYPIVIFFAVIFFVPVFYKLKLTSIYEYLEHRFGVYARTINSLVFLLVQCISAGVILYAVSLILVQILPISISEAIIYISIFTACYSYSGGITTVIWTDLMQAMILMAGTIIIAIYLIVDIHNGSRITMEQLQIINLKWDPAIDTTLWTGLIAISFLHLSVYGSNQLIIQRTLATRSVKAAQGSMLLCGYAAFFIYLLFATLGVLLSIFYQHQTFANSNEVILDFVFHHTNSIVIGLIISALAAAAMSTLDSTYNSMATVLTFDIYKRLLNKTSCEAHYNRIARKMSLVCAAAVVVPALLSISNESVLKTIASLTSIFVGIRLGSFILGLFFDAANEKGVLTGSIVSIMAVLTARYYDIAWPWYAPLGTLSFLLIGLFTSFLWGENSSQQQEFIKRQKQLFTTPSLSHYGLLLFAVITVTACFFIPSWLYTALHTAYGS